MGSTVGGLLRTGADDRTLVEWPARSVVSIRSRVTEADSRSLFDDLSEDGEQRGLEEAEEVLALRERDQDESDDGEPAAGVSDRREMDPQTDIGAGTAHWVRQGAGPDADVSCGDRLVQLVVSNEEAIGASYQKLAKEQSSGLSPSRVDVAVVLLLLCTVTGVCFALQLVAVLLLSLKLIVLGSVEAAQRFFKR
ncbi:unnamed protein product [Amoebophrya sp. A25]|nr:unnamed protein product [Amoebophrya sp. A25]|eukprot:GSA25T00022227001.1